MYVCMCVCIYIYTHTHSYKHTYIHTRAHAHKYAPVDAFGMYVGFTKREIGLSQKANRNIKKTLESKPQKEMEGTRENEKSQRQEEGEGDEGRLTNDKNQIEKLTKRIQQVERELAEKMEKNRTIYVIWAESTSRPEIKMTGQEIIVPMEIEQGSVKMEETEIT